MTAPQPILTAPPKPTPWSPQLTASEKHADARCKPLVPSTPRKRVLL